MENWGEKSNHGTPQGIISSPHQIVLFHLERSWSGSAYLTATMRALNHAPTTLNHVSDSPKVQSQSKEVTLLQALCLEISVRPYIPALPRLSSSRKTLELTL